MFFIVRLTAQRKIPNGRRRFTDGGVKTHRIHYAKPSVSNECLIAIPETNRALRRLNDAPLCYEFAVRSSSLRKLRRHTVLDRTYRTLHRKRFKRPPTNACLVKAPRAYLHTFNVRTSDPSYITLRLFGTRLSGAGF